MPNHMQNTKVVSAVAPGVIINNASWTPVEIDVQGFNYMTLDIHIGTTDIAFAVLKLQSSATSGGALTDVGGTDFSTDGTLPSATDDGRIVRIHVDLRGKARYYKLLATAGIGTLGTYMAATATLSQQDQPLLTAADQGCSQVLYA